MPLPFGRRVMVGGALAVTVVIVVLAALGLETIPGSDPPRTATPRATASPQPAIVDGFPEFVQGMPVLTVGDALALIGDGRLDGRALAVRGWFVQAIMSCPMPGRFMAPLEGFCHAETFASASFQKMTCQDLALDGHSECHENGPPPGVDVLSPFLLDGETSIGRLWDASSRLGPILYGGTPAVLIGHARDPRLWHCPAETQADCARAFVVDRVAWVAGETLEMVPPDRRVPVPDGMVLEEARAAAGIEGEVIAAVALEAGDAPAIDPRLHGLGNGPVWILRALRPGGASDAADPTRAVDVREVDAATGQVIGSTGLEMDAAYQPARLLVQATRRSRVENDDIYPFYRVELPDGTGLQQIRISGGGGSSNGKFSRHAVGLPAVLEPGDYVVRAWLATIGPNGAVGEQMAECMTQVTLDPLGELRIETAFPEQGPCTWGAPTFTEAFEPF